MGRLVNGQWTTEWYEPDAEGRFVRPETQFRSGDVQPELGRYHLFVSYACPWAHRTLIARRMHGLEDAIGVTVVDPFMGEAGWRFPEPDPLVGATLLREIYLAAHADYTGRVTVPVLWDTQRRTIVNNESIEVVRLLDGPLSAMGNAGVSLFPAELQPAVDDTIRAIYQPINNGVYRSGFATTQRAYAEGCRELFDALDHYERVLSEQRFLCGDRLTAADICMFTTLVRFDSVYYTHFKCNVRRIVDYPNLWGFVRDIYQRPEVRPTVHMDHIKQHYYRSHETINPHRIVPIGPAIDFEAPHQRDRV